MSNLKYSPGKWIPSPGGFVHSVSDNKQVRLLCECTFCDDADEMYGNAVLMAASPEMYEILKAICENSSEILTCGEVNDFTVAIHDGVRLLNRLEDWDRKNYERKCWVSTILDYWKRQRERKNEATAIGDL